MRTGAGSASASRPTILVFCRAYLVDDFRENVAPLEGEYDFRFLCDGRKSGTDDTRELFYRNLKEGKRFTKLSAQEREEILERCRLLRNIPRAEAEALVDAMGRALEAWLDHIEPRGILCHMVDEYVTHILALLAEKRGIRFIGYAGSFFPERIQLTKGAYGEAFNVREPSVDEVDATITALTRKGFRQDYAQKLAYSRTRHAYMMARYRVKQVVFWVKGNLERDSKNVHYLITPHVVERRSFSALPQDEDFADDWEGAVSVVGRPVVYLPLAYFPESTIDYWIANRRILDYERITLEIATILGRRFTVLVKEHPHMLGCRSAEFYRRLATIPGVVSAPPLAFSADLMERSNAVVLGAGSGGVEAALRGVPVFSYCGTSYWFRTSGAYFLDLDKIEFWAEEIEVGLSKYRPLDEDRRRVLIADCLASTTRKRGQGQRWPLIDVADLRLLLERAIRMSIGDCGGTGPVIPEAREEPPARVSRAY